MKTLDHYLQLKKYHHLKKLFFALCFAFLVYKVQAQESDITRLKSQVNEVEKTPKQMSIFIQLGILLAKSNPQEAKTYAEKAEKLAASLGNAEGIADAKTILGDLNAYHFDRADKAADYHEKAYLVYRNLYENQELEKWKLYDFIKEHINPAYHHISEKSTKKKKKDKLAIQKYQQLFVDAGDYLTVLASDVKEEISSKETELEKSKTDLGKKESELVNKKTELGKKQVELDKKRASERKLIFEKLEISGNLEKKELEALALSDSLMSRELQLKNEALQLLKAKARTEKLEKEKKLKEAEASRQRTITYALISGIGLGLALIVVVFISYSNQIKANKILIQQKNELSLKHEEINQQKEEIATQRDNIEQQNAILHQQMEEIETQRDNIEQQNTILHQQMKEIETQRTNIEQKNTILHRQMEEIETQKVYLTEMNREVVRQRDKSDELLMNILPEETAIELKETGKATPRYYEMATVMFTDFKGFTRIAEQLTPEQIIKELNYCFLAFDEIIEKYNLEKIKTIGDAYMCAGGLPTPNKTNALDTIRAGLAMQEFMEKFKAEKQTKGESVWELRLGIHTGPLVAGVIGKNKFVYDIWGDTVNLASRMETGGEVGKVNISGNTYELVKNYFKCTYRGKINVKHKGDIDMYFVENKSSLLDSIRTMGGGLNSNMNV